MCSAGWLVVMPGHDLVMSGNGQGASERPPIPGPGAQCTISKAPAFTCPRGLGSVGIVHLDVSLFICSRNCPEQLGPAGLSHNSAVNSAAVWMLQATSSFVSLVSTLGKGHVSQEPPCLWSQNLRPEVDRKRGSLLAVGNKGMTCGP